MNSRLMIVAAVVFASLAVAQGCSAETGSAGSFQRGEGVMEKAAGFWRIEGADGGVCLVALKAEAEGVAHAVNIERCDAPALANLGAWNVQGGAVVLLGRDGRVLVRLEPTGQDLFGSADGHYRMSREPMV
jgi:hypothetical protein